MRERAHQLFLINRSLTEGLLDRSPNERKANLQSFKDKKVKFLICTDVAARGIDVSGLPFMINVTLPDEKSNYVHRIGRVGRAERMGLAISLVSTIPEKVWFHGQWCSSRGKNCWNTNLIEKKGCCIWYNETMVRFIFLKAWIKMNKRETNAGDY